MINKEFFDFQICKGSMNSIPVHCGVITSNENKGKQMMKYILSLFNEDEIERVISQTPSFKQEIKLTNGTIIRWVKPSEAIKGYRFMKGIIDKNIPKEILWYNILPVLCYAKNEDIIYF